MKINKHLAFGLLMLLGVVAISPLWADLTDSYLEDFDGRLTEKSINGIDNWAVEQGTLDDAIVQTDVTFGGKGKALKLIGVSPILKVGRDFQYGQQQPTWIRFRVKPSVSEENPDVPTIGIGAVCFDFMGKILASDRDAWEDTGKTYSAGRWYDVAMKVDFSDHTYDLYVNDSLSPDLVFLPAKSNLRFTDPTINSLNSMKFFGAYSASKDDDVFIDDVSVTFFDRLQILTPPQKLLLEQISSPVTVQLQNSLSEPQSAIADVSLKLQSTSLAGRFSANKEPWLDVTHVVIPKNSQSLSFYYKDTVSSHPVLSVSEEPDQGIADASQQWEVEKHVARFAMQAEPKQTAGQSFSLRITAYDDENNVNVAYAGAVDLKAAYVSPDSGGAQVLPATISDFEHGIAETIITYPDSGVITLNVSDQDDPEKIGTSDQITFLPASFSVEAEPNQIVSKPFSLKVSAKNTSGAITPNFLGTVNLAAIPVEPETVAGALFDPSAISSAVFSNGVATTDIAYNRYGTIKVKVEESTDPTKSGSTEDITFEPKTITAIFTPPPLGRDYFYLGEPVTLTVIVEDYKGKAIENYTGEVVLTSMPGLDFPLQYGYQSSDKGRHQFVEIPTDAKEYSVTVKEPVTKLSAVTTPIKVKNATIQVLDGTSPIGSGEVYVQIVDENGNVITTENNLVVNLSVFEDVDNGSVNFPSQQVVLKNGRALVPISNSEAEVVTVVPSSALKIKNKEGKVTFGRAGKTGISPLMQREIKNKK